MASNISPETRERLEALALSDHQQIQGQYLRCNYICGTDARGDSIDAACDVIVRVQATSRDSILHWNDEWLDPYWDVEVARFLAPPTAIVLNHWIDGPSYNAATGEREWNGVQALGYLEYLNLTGFPRGILADVRSRMRKA